MDDSDDDDYDDDDDEEEEEEEEEDETELVMFVGKQRVRQTKRFIGGEKRTTMMISLLMFL